MQEMLTHPAFQSAIAPLVCGMLVALLLRPFGVMWQGLAVVAGFFVAVWLTVGLSFQPLTSTRKIILASILLPFLSFPLVQFSGQSWKRTAFLALITSLAALWVIWPALGRQEGLEVWLTAGRVIVFTTVVTGLLGWVSRENIVKEGGSLLALGLGTGASAFIGASALYGQLAFSIVASLGGMLLVLLLIPSKQGSSTQNSVGSIGSFSLFAAVIPLAIIGGASTVYAKLPITAMLFLALVPLFAGIPFDKKLNLQNLWFRGSLATALGLLPAVIAIWLAWNASEPMGY